MTLTKLTGAAIAAGLILTANAAPARADHSEAYCREYTRLVQIGGRTQEAYGTACLQPDGAWRIVDEDLDNKIVASRPRDYNDIDRERVVYVESGPQVVFIDRGYRRYGHSQGRRGHRNRFHHVHHGKLWPGHKW